MKYIQTDITTVDRGVIAHGVNCQGKMGSGVAKAIRHKWPEVYEVFRRAPIGKGMLGSCHLVTIETGTLFVANCYTQVFYGIGGRFASPDAIEESLWKAFNWANYFDVPIYLPKIGAGLGGLNWKEEVEPIILALDDKLPDLETYICVLGEDEL